MKNLKVLRRRGWALSHGFILARLTLVSIGLALGLGHYIGGMSGLVIAGICCFAGGFCFIFIPTFRKLAQKYKV